jgi:hypothetical protein
MMYKFWQWLKSLFITRYRITVSYNNEWGDSDDKEFISKKVITQKEKHLKFRDNDGKLIEIRSVQGLHYRIEEL